MTEEPKKLQLLRILSLAAVFGGFAIIFPDARFVGVLLIAAGCGLFAYSRRSVTKQEQPDEAVQEEIVEVGTKDDFEYENWVTPAPIPVFRPDEAYQPVGMKVSLVEERLPEERVAEHR
jgi:hypothetical protein